MHRSLSMTLVGFLLIIGTTMAQKHHPNHHIDEKSAHSANEYMHRSSVDQLVQRFESPERDSYQQPEKVLDYLGNFHGKRIMDIGAGSGYFSIKLAQAGATVIAADVNDEFQQHLKQRIEKEKLHEAVELRKLTYDNPQLKEKEVDIVFLSNTYHHIEDREIYFAKVKRGIDLDGYLVIIDYFKADLPVGPPVDHKVSMDQIISELKIAGFNSFDVEVDLLPYQFIIVAK